MNRYFSKFLIVFSFFIFHSSFFISAYAQVPTDLSKMKASQITDAQLMQFVQQAQTSGLSEADLLQQFQQRGLPESEIQLLAARVKSIMPSQTELTPSDNQKNQSNKRTFKGEETVFKMPGVKSRVFGADLFSSADPLFVPNLKIATPKNYVIGPEDELQLDVYGNNISNQKLTVSPDGYITVKYAGPVNVNGMTIEQVAGVLKSRLTKFYPSLSSGETKVQLTLGSIRSIQVTIVGAVKKPGTITISSLSTLFNALYACGGPTEIGSFRNIELIRNNKQLLVADLYDFLLKGEQVANVGLRDNDVILVPFVQTQVVLDGGLNRPGIFEVKTDETLEKVLGFAGGFKSSAFKGRITGTRYTDTERKVIDIGKEGFSSFKLAHGDSLHIDLVVNRYQNRVIITGSVFKPGAYAMEEGMTIKNLIEKAQGLKEDAFTGRANISRLRSDFSKEFLSVDLRAILKGEKSLLLQKEDSIHVVSLLELRDRRFVTINGPVKIPGDFTYEDSLTLQSLILQAGGFQDLATAVGIEVGRRKKDIVLNSKGAATAVVFKIEMSKDLTKLGSDFYLQPYDVVSIKSDPTNLKQTNVKLSGELLYKGVYTLENPDERLSSVIKRAGGLLPYANIDGAKLVRKKENVDTVQLKRLGLSASKNSKLNGNNDSAGLRSLEGVQAGMTEVALNLKNILAKPGSDDDITLRDGDELIVPRFDNTVSISGEVLKPVTVQFEVGKGFSSYLSASGGFTRKAYRGLAFVVYPNGGSAKTHQFLGIRRYPRITPGSSIFIPSKPDVNVIDAAKAGILVSALSAVMTGLALLFR
jgi:protein involved in polysaccharide export with SLBB domain